MSKKSGFTLIELLIVVSIIGVLAAIALFSYQIFLKNSRDAKRQSDLKFIQSALEQYHGDQKYYPATINFEGSLSYGTRVYLNNVPSGPVGVAEYKYRAYLTNDSDCTDQCAKYCLYAKAENFTPPNTSCADISGFPLEVTPP